VDRRSVFALALLYTLAIGTLSLISFSNFQRVEVEGADKMVHAAFHFVFTIIWYWYFIKSGIITSKLQIRVRVILMSILYGALIEALQHMLTTTRRADYLDLAANIAGACLAIVVLVIFEKFTASTAHK
jgi:glycopeptide antibiotics resistance protein